MCFQEWETLGINLVMTCFVRHLHLSFLLDADTVARPIHNQPTASWKYNSSQSDGMEFTALSALRTNIHKDVCLVRVRATAIDIDLKWIDCSIRSMKQDRIKPFKNTHCGA